jgi:hypothetical protein
MTGFLRHARWPFMLMSLVNAAHVQSQEANHSMSNQEVLRRIAQIDKPHEETMRNNPTTFQWRVLPFYRRFKLLVADVNLRHRPIELRYADDGTEIYVLGATPEHIYKVNEREALRLGPADVPSYVRFFYENIGTADITVTERAEDLRWLPSVQTEAGPKRTRNTAESMIHPIRAVSASGGFSAVATALHDDALVEITLSVASDGRVELRNQKPLLEKLPVVQVLH